MGELKSPFENDNADVCTFLPGLLNPLCVKFGFLLSVWKTISAFSAEELSLAASPSQLPNV